MDKHIEPRRRAASGIKLLRLDLVPQGKSPCTDLGIHWSPAQPTEKLSPLVAAKNLGIEVWAPASVVHKRYRTLQMRYPPEQFLSRHLEWRPSFQLLGSPILRLNWFWQSGLIPEIHSSQIADEKLLWDMDSCEESITPLRALERIVDGWSGEITAKDH